MNYDFLTLEDYNSILNNFYNFFDYYYLPFEVITGLNSIGNVIDGFLTIVKQDDNNYNITVENALFNGGYCLFKAENSSVSVLSSSEDITEFKLTINDDDVVNGSFVLLFDNCHSQVNVHSVNYIFEGLNQVFVPFLLPVLFKKEITVLNLDGSPATNISFNINTELPNLSGTFVTDSNGVLNINADSIVCNSDYPVFLNVNNKEQGLFYINVVKNKPLFNISSDSVLYQGFVKAELLLTSLSNQEFDYELIYNNCKITGTKEAGTTSIPIILDLKDHKSEDLQVKLNILESNNSYNETFVYDLTVPRFTGTINEISEMMDYEPTICYIEPTTIGVLRINNCIIQGIDKTRIERLAIFGWDNITFKDIYFSPICYISNNCKNIVFEDCIIDGDYLLHGLNSGLNVKMINCTLNFKKYDDTYGGKGFIFNGKLELVNCTLSKTEYTDYISPAFMTLKDNAELKMTGCKFILEYSTNYKGILNNFFDISSNAIVNGITGKQLMNNDSFPFLNNKSEIDLTYGNKHLTGNNGITWLVDGKGNYEQNVKVE